VELRLAATEHGDVVLVASAAHEAHLVFDPVAELEAELVLVKGDGLVGVSGGQDDVAELHRNRFLLFEDAEGTRGDVTRYLDDAAVRVEEAEAVATTRRLQRAGLRYEARAGRSEVGGDFVNVGRRVDAKRQGVDALLVRLTDAQDVLLRRALRGEV